MFLGCLFISTAGLPSSCFIVGLPEHALCAAAKGWTMTWWPALSQRDKEILHGGEMWAMEDMQCRTKGSFPFLIILMHTRSQLWVNGSGGPKPAFLVSQRDLSCGLFSSRVSFLDFVQVGVILLWAEKEDQLPTKITSTTTIFKQWTLLPLKMHDNQRSCKLLNLYHSFLLPPSSLFLSWR